MASSGQEIDAYGEADDYASGEGHWDNGRSGGFFSRVPWGRVGIALVLAFFVAAAVLFVWNRWYRYDDALDLRGTWRDAATGSLLELDGEHLRIARDVVYAYTLDTAAKTITYHLGDDTGFSSYRFSEDRKQLVLEDGVGTDWGLVLHFRDDPGFAQGQLPDGLTRLEKASDDVPIISLPGSARPAKPITSETSGLGLAASSGAVPEGDASSSSDASSSDEPPAPVEYGDGKFIGAGYGESSSSQSEGASSDDSTQNGTENEGSDYSDDADTDGSNGSDGSDAYSDDTDSYDSYNDDTGSYDSYSDADSYDSADTGALDEDETDEGY